MAARRDATVVIEGNTTSFNTAMREAARAIQIANAEFKKATAGMDKWGDSADGVRAKLKQLQDILKQENNKLSALKQNYEQMAKKYGENSDKAQELTVRIKKQEAQIAKTEAEINKYNTQLSAMEDAEKEAAEGNEKLADSFDDVAKKSQNAKTGLEKFASYLGSGIKGAAKVAGKAILAIGTAAVGAGAASVKAGMSFDEQMSTVKAISGATEEEFEQLRKKALEMGSTTKFTATESGKALEYMGMAGWKAQDMLEGLPGIINAAAASGEDLGTVSDIITDGLTAFGLQAEDSSHFADVLAAASANANTNISLMGDTFKYVAPVAGALKYSIDDVAVGVGLMANAGIKADQAGTSLRSILSRMAAPTKNVAAAMEQLGISMTDDDGNMKSFNDLLIQLRESFSKLNDQEKAKYANDIAGKTAMSGMLALVNTSSQEYDKLTESIKNADGAAKEMADTRLDNLQGDVTIFKSALEGAAVSISDQMAPALREFVQEGTAMIPELSGDIADLGGELAGVATGLMPIIKDTVQALVPVAKDIMGVIKDILPYLSEIFQSLLPVAEKLLQSIIKVVKPMVENVLPPLTKFIDGIAKVLDGLLDVLTPILEVISKIYSVIYGGFLTAWTAVIDSIMGGNAAFDDAYKKFSQLSDAEQDNIDKLNDLKTATDAAAESRKNSIDGADAEYSYYRKLAEELDSITDKNGEIKQGYEDRANVITSKLSEALGIEIEITDGVIQKYSELRDEINKTIELKKGEAILSANESNYADAIQRQAEATKEMANAQAQLADNESKLREVEVELDGIEQQRANHISIDKDRYEELQGAQKAYEEKILDTKQRIKEYGETYAVASAEMANYAKLEEDVVNGHYENVQRDIQYMQENFMRADTATKDMVINQTASFRRMYETLQKQAEESGDKLTQEMADNYLDMYYKSRAEMAKFPGMTQEKINDVLSTFDGANSSFQNAGAQNAANYENGLIGGLNRVYDTAVSTAQSIADSISQIISSASVNLNLNANVSTSPKTATGGIVTRAQTRIVGEDGAEAIVPLEKNTGWIDAVAQKVVLSMGGAGARMQNVTNNYNFNQTNNSPKALSRLEIYRQSRNLLSFKKA